MFINSIRLLCLSNFEITCYFFDDFPKISEHFPMISEDSIKVVQRPVTISKHFPKIYKDCQRFPKIIEDFQGRTDDVPIIQ